MTERKVEKVVETIEHSFENVLGVPSGTTEIEKTRVVSEPTQPDEYDTKDNEIEEDLVEIQDKALELHEHLVDEIEDADPSKRARLAEVADQVLNTALSSLDKRRSLKQHKDILKQKDRAIDKKGGPGGTTQNNLFIGSHDEVLEYLAKNLATDDDKIIDHKDDE